jgi:hypothetical protein
MNRGISLLLCALSLGCTRHKISPDLASEADQTPPPLVAQGEITALLGAVPEHDFAMPMLASEILPGSIQGCFLSTEPQEGIIAVYPKDMARPERERPIQMKGRMQIVKQKPPSSPDAIQMRWYEQKVLIVTSWEYTETGS